MVKLKIRKFLVNCVVLSGVLGVGFAQMGIPKPSEAPSKPKYDLQFEYLEISNYSTDYFRDVVARVKKFNRTVYVISATFESVKTFDNDFTAIIQPNAYQGNEYRAVGAPITYNKLCTKLGEDNIAYPDILKASNFPTLPDNCPVPPGKWWVKDFLAKTDNFPELPNSEKWRCDMTITYKGKFAGTGSLYMILKRINSY